MFQISSFHLLYIPLMFLIPIFILFKKSKSKADPKSSPNKLPPGPWKLPLFGNLHQLIGSTLPHRSLRDLSNKYGRVMTLRFGEVLTVVVSSKEAAREVMGTQELLFAQRPSTLGVEAMSFAHHGGLFSAPYGDYWRLMRRVTAAQLLIPKRVESLRPVREDEARRMGERVRECSARGEAVNLSEALLSMAIGTVSGAAFGERSRRHDEYVALIKEVLALSTGFTVADCFPSVKWLECLTGMRPKLDRIRRRASEILDEVVDDHKVKINNGVDAGEEQDDLFDVLLRLTQSSDLKFEVTENHIKTVVHDLVGAGGETTATALDWAMVEMLRNRRVLDKAQAEVRRALGGKAKVEEADIQGLDYLQCIIKETLRLHPSAPLLGREARAGCKITGFDIPCKAKIVISAWALGRDPELWGANAECFEPERFVGSSVDLKGADFEFLPFGAGRRICPGIPFSFPNMEIVLARLLYHFDWGLPNGGKLEELDMSEEYQISCRRKSDLCLVATLVRPFSQ